ncbi:MAG: hypothetical protein ABI852_12050 [Gemmatimonadaceae bacterium]
MNPRSLGVAVRLMTLVVAMFAASTLSAQSDGTELLSDARARDAIQQVIRNTQSKNVSIEPLLLKVREGVSKQSEPALIQQAVRVLAKRLEISSAALAPTYSVEELSAGANALLIGVPAPTLRELRKLWPNKPLTVPLGILYELVAHQVPVAKATKRVRELMERGATSSQLVAMATNVEADVAAGLSADAALELRAKGVMSLLPTPVGTATIVPSKPRIRPK